MAAIPSAKETVRDFGTSISEPASMAAVLLGHCSLGAVNALQFFSSIDELRTQRGEGPLVEAAAEVLSQGGGPVGLVRLTAPIAAAIDEAVPPDAITATGTPTLDALIRVDIVAGGGLGEARFRYCLDGYEDDTKAERTYSEDLTVPTGGAFEIPGLGVTLTFDATPGDLVEGDSFTIPVQCAACNATTLAEGFAALGASPSRWRFCYFVTSKGNGDVAAHALLAAALQAHLDAMSHTSKYRRGMLAASWDDTDTTAQIGAAFENVVAVRLLIGYGAVRRASAKPFSGYAFPVTSATDVFAARAAKSLPSTDLKRVKSGPLSEVVKLFHDEFRTPSGLDDVKVSTLRTYENAAGFYITQGRLKSPAGSDFTHWPRGIVMDIACETINAVLTNEIGRGVRYATVVIDNQSYPGVIDDRDATVIETEAAKQLVAQLASPLNAEGFEGHVTNIRYRMSRTHNVLATGTIIGALSIQGLGYIDNLETTLGYVVELPTG